MNAVELTGVTKSFGKHLAVDDLSLEVPVGSIYGFIGPNGSGMTTTMRMIVNMLYPDRGSVRVFGRQVQGSRFDRVAYMPEDRGLYKRMKVRDLLRFYGGLQCGRDLREEVDGWLGFFDLTDWAGERVETLSKGMRQKVQFIAAVVAGPQLLILDEPFSGLDPVNAYVIREAILDLKKRGATVLLSTHDMNVAERMCDRILMIFRGKKVLDGTLAEIQQGYGSDSIRIRVESGSCACWDLAGVDAASDFGQVQELKISPGYDPQEVLRVILRRTRVQSFEVGRVSLHDIFVRMAAPTGGNETVRNGLTAPSAATNYDAEKTRA